MSVGAVRTCYLCHLPLSWGDSTTTLVTEGLVQIEVEVHADCLARYKPEQRRAGAGAGDASDIEAAITEFADHPSWTKQS